MYGGRRFKTLGAFDQPTPQRRVRWTLCVDTFAPHRPSEGFEWDAGPKGLAHVLRLGGGATGAGCCPPHPLLRRRSLMRTRESSRTQLSVNTCTQFSFSFARVVSPPVASGGGR